MDNLAINFLDALLTPFRWVYFGLAGCALLIFVALISVRRMKKESAEIIADIDKANEALSKFESAESFTNQFHVIDGQLKGINRLSRSWEEFSKTLLPPLDEINEPEYRVFRTTKRPVDYFDIDHLSSKVKPIIDSESLIGIGLVLTFFGLVAALIHAGLKIGGTVDTQEVQVAIQNLLSTAGAKFFASIGGVGGSLIQTIFMNRTKHQIDEKLKVFNDRLERLLIFASLERIAADQYGHAKRQTARLEEMSTEITLAIGEKIESAMLKMPVMMGEAMNPVAEQLSTMTDKLSRSSTDALKEMVADFRGQLQGAGESTMNHVVTQLSTLSTTLNDTVGSLAQSNHEITNGIQTVMLALTETTKKFDSSVQASADAASSQLASSSAALTAGLESVLSDLSAQQASANTAMASLVERLDTASKEAAVSLKNGSDKASANVASGITEAMKVVLDQAKSATKDVTDSVGTGIGDLVSALGRINQEIDRHNQGLQLANSKLQDTASAMGGAAESVRASTQPLSQVSLQLTAASDAIRKSVADTFGQVERLVATTDAASKGISSAITKLAETWESQAGQLSSADEELEGAFNAITQNLSQSLDVLQRFTVDLESKMAGALNNLASIVQELSDALEDSNTKRN
jgi:hypothetical protein